MTILRVFPLLIPLCLSGCVSTVATVATAPFRVAGKAVDLATTSPSERDRAYTRRMRKQQERADRERRDLAKRCRRDPDAAECGERPDGQVAPMRGTSPAR